MMPFYQNFSVLGLRNVLKYVSRIQESRNNYAFHAKMRERYCDVHQRLCT